MLIATGAPPGPRSGLSFEICAVASAASPHTFARSYRLDVIAPTLSHSVLSVTQSVRECASIIPPGVGMSRYETRNK